MKKATMQSIGIGSLVLTAITAGAWFMFSAEPAQEKKIVTASSSSPSQSPPQKTEQQEETKPPLKEEALAGEQQGPPSELSQETPTEKPPVETTVEELKQAPASEDGEKTATGISPAPSEPTDNEDNESEEKTLTGQTKVSPAAQPASPPLSEKQPSGNKQAENEIKKRIDEIKKELSQSQDLSHPDQQVAKKIPSGPSCTQVSPTLSNFFDKLEEKQYSKENNSTQPLQEHFNGLATQLVNNPPVVAHETDELYTLLTNTAHFFRILGKDNMRLLQKVVKQEHGDFEKIAAEMYRLSLTGEECVSGEKKLEIPFTSAYEYAGFFLNTLGGRSYLFRRDPGTRLLVNYYAVLLLDQANKKNLNVYGLDMTEHLPWLIQEMEASNRLTNKEGYLDKLYELAENYQALP